jgi:erythromycin esterase
MKYILLSIFVLCAVGCRETTSTLLEDRSGLNLDFEQSGANNRPTKWYFSGSSYSTDLDSQIVVSGKKSLRIGFKDQVGDGYYVWCAKLPVDAVRGKKVTYLAHIRTESVTDGYVRLWFRVDGPNDSVLANDTMGVKGVSGTTEWKQYKIELPVDSTATHVEFGVHHGGKGIAWLDKVEILVDGKSYEKEIFTPTEKQIEWLREQSHPFKTPEAETGFEDLSWIKGAFGNAEIIGLGEATHGTKEFFQMKHRLTEYLANNMGYTIFAIEADMPECAQINSYVLGGPGNVHELLKNLSLVWNTKEVVALIEWMRSYNMSGRGRIEFTGFDMQADSIAAENVLTFLTKNEPTYAAVVRKKFSTIRQRITDAEINQSYGDPRFSTSITDAVEIFEHIQHGNYEKTTTQKEIDWAVQNANIVLQAAHSLLTDLYYSTSYRDSCMAVNIKWIKDHAAPDAKLILWAHNAHIAKGESWRMGDYLNKLYGKKYCAVGFKFHDGSYTAWSNGSVNSSYRAIPSYPGTLDWILHSLNMPRFILNLQSASTTDPQSNWLYQLLETKDISARANDEYLVGNVASEFDAIIFFDHTTPSEVLPN